MSAPMLNIDLNTLADMSDAEVAAVLESFRVGLATVRQNAVARGLPIAAAGVRKLSPSGLMIIQRRLARLRYQVDVRTAAFNETTTEFSEARTAFLASHGITEFSEELAADLAKIDADSYQELVTAAAERDAAPKEPKAPSENSGRRGRPRKVVEPATEVAA